MDPACVIVADDLTGACDSAVPFAAAGLRTVAAFGEPVEPAEVLALSTESRDAGAAEAVCRLRRIAGRARAPIVFKKIDSTLRGNTGVEIVAALEAFGCEAAVVTPAFPALGRIVESGRLRVVTDPAFLPVEIAPWLRAAGADSCRHVPAGGIAEAIEGGARFVSVDAVCTEDLARIAAEIHALPRRILWAGSGGLAAALAPRLGAAGPAPELPRASGPVLFCIGSDHPVTMEQQRRLVETRGAILLDARAAAAEDLRGRSAVLRIPRGRVAVKSLAELFDRFPPAAFFLSGGDTASLVCRALAARAIELRREFLPGMPAGVLHGGPFEGTAVFTKSGGFGSPEDLVQLADSYHA